ncbi:MAG: IS1380 family transposase, partial [Jatrophihabitantaceae bacterium]
MTSAVAARFLAGLARHAPLIGSGNTVGEPVAYLDIDDTLRTTYGYAKQGAVTATPASKGSTATISTRVTAPVTARH